MRTEPGSAGASAALANMPRASEESHPDLFSKVSAALAGLEGGGAEEPPAEEPIDSAPTPEPEESADEGADAEGDEPTPEGADDEPVAATDEDAEGAAEGDESSPTLPPAHVRSLKAYGWDDDEIADHIETYGFDAMAKTASKLHLRRVAETKVWAADGRRERESSRTPVAPQSVPASQLPAPKTGLQRIDTEALKRKHEGDEFAAGLIDQIAGPVNETISALEVLMPQVSRAIERTKAAEAAGTAKQLDEFFGAPSLKPYADLYGQSFQSATPDQFAARNDVLTYADALIVGAARQGRPLALVEALELAHDAVSSEFKTAAVRKEIKSQVKKRGASVSLKPSTRTSPALGKSRDAKEREARVGAMLRTVFN